MPSINNLTPGARSMNGLNTLSANDINADTLDVDVLIVNSAGTAPNRPLGDDTTNIANTAFVKDAVDAATANLVTTNTSQTILSGATKFFTTNPQSLTSAAPTLNNEYTNKLYVDTQISTAGGSFVTLSGALQTVTGNKDFTGTTRLGDALSADQPCKVSIMNNTTSDTSVNGTIGNESVYHQIRYGARAFYISQGLTDNQNQYFGVSGSGAPDPEFVLTLRNGVGIKISNGLDTSSFTEQLKVVGTSRFTGVGTFEVPPVSATNPTTATQVCNKQYTDAGNGASILPLNNTFTGNNTFNPATGTTSIRGNQVDIFPTITYLTSPTTTISGTILNGNSTQTWLNGQYNNLAGTIQTTLRSPTTLITGATCQYFTNQASIQTAFSSPSFLITNACTSFDVRATNTYLENSVVTCANQIITDYSQKIANTKFVVDYSVGNYMTLTSNQNVSGVKTYSTQQIFNAGLTSNNIYASGTTDMSLGSNMGNGILNIDSSKIICDTFGVRMVNLNTQLNEGCFIQPNPSLAGGEAPSINFPNDAVANFTNFVGASGTGEATKQINIGVVKFWCGNNQSSVFSLTHSLTNGYAIGPGAWEEQIITFSFVDANTGITRYVTPNYSTTGVFSMPSLGTVVRPTITFTLDTNTLPQAVYNIFVYVKIVNAFINQALNTMTWNLSASPSTLTTTQNYNTYKDYTFTSRNLYHCFRNYVAGVYIINNIAVAQNIMLPIFYSVTDLTNIMSQPTTSGAVPTTDGGAIPGETGVGNYNVLGCDNKDNYWLVYPGYGLKVYNSAGWNGTVYLNYRNKERNPVVVAGTTIQGATSVKVYFDGIELIKF
jgi:hypothetical protein